MGDPGAALPWAPPGVGGARGSPVRCCSVPPGRGGEGGPRRSPVAMAMRWRSLFAIPCTERLGCETPPRPLGGRDGGARSVIPDPPHPTDPLCDPPAPRPPRSRVRCWWLCMSPRTPRGWQRVPLPPAASPPSPTPLGAAGAPQNGGRGGLLHKHRGIHFPLPREGADATLMGCGDGGGVFGGVPELCPSPRHQGGCVPIAVCPFWGAVSVLGGSRARCTNRVWLF